MSVVTDQIMTNLGQGKVKARSGQVNNNVKARSRRGLGKVKARLRKAQDKVRRQGQGKINVRLKQNNHITTTTTTI